VGDPAVGGAAGEVGAAAGAGTGTAARAGAGADARGGAGVTAGSGASSGAGVSAGRGVRAGETCGSAGVLGGVDSGVLPSAVVLVGGEGERLTATMKNTGARTSAARDWRRLLAVPLRIRRKDTIAGIIAMRHSRPPNAPVAGIAASTAPRTAMTNVTAPRRLRGNGGWGALIRMGLSRAVVPPCR
jgi:hypothetical protein